MIAIIAHAAYPPDMTGQKTITGRDWGLILILSILWGGAFFFNEVALEGMPPNTLVFLRMSIAAIPLLVILKLTGQSLPKGRSAWMGLSLIGVLNIVFPFILFTSAQTLLSSGLSSVLNATTPLWGVVTAHFLTADEKATPLRVAGVLLGIAGVSVMILPEFGNGITGSLLAQIACLVATFCYACGAIVALRLNLGGMSPMSLATGQIVTSALLMIPVFLITDQPWTLPMPGMSAICATLGVAFLSTTLAYALYFQLLESAGASNSLIVTFLIPVTATALGVLFLGELVSGAQVAGAGLIALGLLAMDGRLFRRGKH